jgi:integrase
MVMDAYIAEKLGVKKPRTVSDYLDVIGRLRRVFGDVWPEDVEPKHVYEYLRTRQAKIRANREIAVLSNVMQQAIEMGLINTNPCRQVRRNPESPKSREVTETEVRRFMLCCPAWLQAYIELKMLTGLRQGDMLVLSKFAVRDDGLFVETGKRGKRLLFQWTPALKDAVGVCKDLRRMPSEARLFPITARGFKSAWSRAMAKFKAGELKHERFAENDLRAKVASEAIDMGLDATSMLGHSSDAVTRRHYIRGTRKVQPLR